MLNLNDIHRDAWRHRYADTSAQAGRDFLFAFQVSGRGRPVIQTRSTRDPAPLRAAGLYLLSCRFAPIKRNGKIEKPVPMTHFEPWLADLLARNGMDLLRLDAAEPLAVPLGRTGKSKSTRGPTLHTVQARFVVHVADLSLACHAYQHGIGRHKAWGCGMLDLLSSAERH